jgi:hypothetical protein
MDNVSRACWQTERGFAHGPVIRQILAPRHFDLLADDYCCSIIEPIHGVTWTTERAQVERIPASAERDK